MGTAAGETPVRLKEKKSSMERSQPKDQGVDGTSPTLEILRVPWKKKAMGKHKMCLHVSDWGRHPRTCTQVHRKVLHSMPGKKE